MATMVVMFFLFLVLCSDGNFDGRITNYRIMTREIDRFTVSLAAVHGFVISVFRVSVATLAVRFRY